jgi:predicted dehydrogenase
MSQLRLAMIGCGQISDRYFKMSAQRPAEDVRFVATCARRLDHAERKAREFGVERWFDHVETMLDAVKPDGVVVTTPHSQRVAPCLAAFARGIHVLNEKPMATSFADCKELVASAEKTGCVFMSLPFDHSPAFLTALDHLNEATLGKFTGGESVRLLPGPPRANWYYDSRVAWGKRGEPGEGTGPRGGAMLDCLVYPVSRVVQLLGAARRVSGFVNNLIPRRLVRDGRVESDVDDNVTLVVEFAGGQQVVCRTLWGTAFKRNETALYGRRGTLWFNDPEIIVQSPERRIAGAERVTWQGAGDCWRVPVRADIPPESFIDHFAHCIRARSEPKCSGRRALHIHEILFKGYEAAETGRAQTLTTAYEPWHAIAPDFLNTREGYV